MCRRGYRGAVTERNGSADSSFLSRRRALAGERGGAFYPFFLIAAAIVAQGDPDADDSVAKEVAVLGERPAEKVMLY